VCVCLCVFMGGWVRAAKDTVRKTAYQVKTESVLQLAN